MKLRDDEARFLTALAREQNQTGCRGPAHDLLRQHAYPDVPRSGPGSLTFSYDAVPLIGLLLREFTDLQAIDDFLRSIPPDIQPQWPWGSADDYQARLADAQREGTGNQTPTVSSSR